MTPLCVVATVALSQGEPLSYDRVVARVVEARRAIRSCRVHLAWSMNIHEAGSASAHSHGYEMWLDGERLRADTLPDAEASPDSQRHASGRHVRCRNCLGAGLDTLYTARKTSVYTVPRGQRSPAGDATLLFDPRAIGTSFDPLGQPASRTIGTGLNEPHWTGHTAGPDPDSGGRLVLLAANISATGTARCWIDPDRGYNPVRFEVVGTGDGDVRFTITQTVALAQDAVSGRWFPSKLTFRYVRAGRPHLDEDVTVRAAEIDRPVDPAVFTLAGFGLPKGEMVHPAGRAEPGYWDGSRVAKEPLSEVRDVVPAVGPPPERVGDDRPTGRWPTVVGAVVVATIGAWLLRRAWRG